MVGVAACVPAWARAQTFSSRDAFFAASDDTVRARLAPVDLDKFPELRDALVAQKRVVASFFGLTPEVIPSDSLEGTVFRGPRYIYFNARQLLALRDSVPGVKLTDLVRFVLAHETAHMLQYFFFSPDSLRDPFKLRAIECDADIWAGIATINIAADEGVAPATISSYFRNVSAAAFRLGNPAWEDETKHPDPFQRALCVAVGMNAGMQLRLVRRYESTRDPSVLAQINMYRALDPRWFGPGDTVQKWTKETAKAIVHYGGMTYASALGPLDFAGSLLRLAEATNLGAAALRAQRDSLRMPPPIACALHANPLGNALTCVEPPAPSAAMGDSSFATSVALVRESVASLGWVELSPQATPTLRAQSFIRPDGAAGMIIMFDVVSRAISMTYSARY